MAMLQTIMRELKCVSESLTVREIICVPQVYFPVCNTANNRFAIQHVHSANDAVLANPVLQDKPFVGLEPLGGNGPVAHKRPASRSDGHGDQAFNHKDPSPATPSV